eukprot:jgi/Botrbrau1/16146/Bobra.0281s0003.1
MRIGNILGGLLDASQGPIFGADLGPTDLLPEEAWHPSCLPAQPVLVREFGPAKATLPDQAAAAPNQAGGSGRMDADADSLASETDSDDDSIGTFEVPPEEDDDGADAGDKPLQLRDVAAMLRKNDDSQGVMKGLKVVNQLLSQAPEELAIYAGEMARALLHTRPPDWGEEEAATPEEKPEEQRARAIVGLLMAVPREGGRALVAEVYSPHLDLHQRLLILESLATAATQMAALPGQATAATHMAALPGQATAGAPQLPDRARAGRTRVYAPRALAKLGLANRPAHRNRFPEVALEWARGLLKECGVPHQGVDLFGRDALLLGRLLVTLGAFVEAAAPAPVTAQLALALMELVGAGPVHASPHAFVRRAALIACSQVMVALPPSRVAGALLGKPGLGSDAQLLDRLEWGRAWALKISSADPDPSCRDLARACCGLQASLAKKALEAVEAEAPTSLLPVPSAAPNIVIPRASLQLDSFRTS